MFNLRRSTAPVLSTAVTQVDRVCDHEIIEAARALNDRATTLQNSGGSQSSEIATLTNTIATHNSQLVTAQANLSNAIARADTAQARLNGMIRDNALRESRITLAQRDHWKAEFEKDLAAAETALANQAPALNTESKMRDLGNQKNAYDTAAGRQAALTAFISEQMANCVTYDDSWQRAKTEKADISASMVSSKP